MRIDATTAMRVYGSHDAWSLSPDPDGRDEGRWCTVSLSIVGRVEDGFFLVMAPEGFFAADSWFPDPDMALAAARERFGVEREAWRTV